MTDTKISPSAFSTGILNSIKILSHVWAQVDALERRIDEEIIDSLKRKAKLAVTKSGKSSVVKTTGDVKIGYSWRYELRDVGEESKRGRKRFAGYMHFQVSLSPSDDYSPDEINNFIPSIGVYVGGSGYSCEELDLYLAYPYGDGCTKVIDERYGQATLGVFCQVNDDEPTDLWAYLPLESVDSRNVKSLLLDLAEKLAAHWRDIESKRGQHGLG